MKRYRCLLFVVMGVAATATAFARHDLAKAPYVYSVENSGAHYPAPHFPDFDRLPIVRPLPDPFRFFNGTRNTSFAAWEKRRNEIEHRSRSTKLARSRARRI